MKITLLALAPGIVNMVYVSLGAARIVQIRFSVGYFVGFALFTIACIVVVMMLRRRSDRAQKLAQERRGAVCIHCLYELPIDGDIGTCPECGKPYIIESNRIAWGLPIDRESRGKTHAEP